MSGDGDEVELELDGRRVRISTPHRVLWPATGTTKLELVDYLLAVAPVLLPHLRDRGLTLRRFPEGLAGRSWYGARCRGRPPWLATQDVTGAGGERLRYCIVEDRASLAWVANVSTLELHPFLAPASAPDEPAALVFDLDPGPPSGVLEAAVVALRIRAVLADLGLPSVAKTSGARGVHVFVPLAPGHRFADTKAAARLLAERLAAERPDLVTARATRTERRGRVLVDWLQNDPTRSTVAAYSPRATPVPLVSTPVAWVELDAAVATGRASALRFSPLDVLRRVERLGDLFAPALGPGYVLPPPERFAAGS